jgi:hypothetical protein
MKTAEVDCLIGFIDGLLGAKFPRFPHAGGVAVAAAE